MSRLRFQSFLLLAPLFFLLLNFGLALGNTLWADNPVARFTWTAENANSNRTGLGVYDNVYGVVYGKNLVSQPVHSNFALNTNSCASCHLTHLAPGSGLLFQRSIYNTCSTCHFDAIMGGYDVLTGRTFRGARAGGGRFFDGDFAAQAGGRRGVSFHVTTGVYEHWQAPGSGFSSPPPDGSPWRQPFTCASCHGPHGTFSGRHLHFNVNGQPRLNVNGLPVHRFGPTELESVPGEGYLVPSTDRERTPWLFYDQNSPHYATHAVQIVNSAGQNVTAAFSVNNRLGQVKQQAEAGQPPFRISFSQASVVDLEVQYAGTATETVVYRGGVVNFCTACHTGYLQQRTVGGSVYLYTQHDNFAHPIDSDITPFLTSGFIADPDDRFRLEHQGGEQQLVCLSCHFAHGTDAERMTERDFVTPAYDSTWIPPQTNHLRFGSEANGNREVCLVCHAATDSRLTNNLAVLSTQPLARTSVVGPLAELLIRFDQRIELSSVILGGKEDVTATLRVFERVYDPVLGTTVFNTVYGTVAARDSHRTLVFTPREPLPAGEYEVEVTQGVHSWFGRTLPQLFAFLFNVT